MSSDGWLSSLESLDGAAPPRHSAWTSQRDCSRGSSEHKLRRQEKGRERKKRYVSKAPLVAPQAMGTGFQSKAALWICPASTVPDPGIPALGDAAAHAPVTSPHEEGLWAAFQASSVYPLHWQRAVGNICSDGHGSAWGFGYLGSWCESSRSPWILTASAGLGLLVSTQEQLANPLPAWGGYWKPQMG